VSLVKFRGIFPSVREIQVATGRKSVCPVQDGLKQLVAKGWIAQVPKTDDMLYPTKCLPVRGYRLTPSTQSVSGDKDWKGRPIIPGSILVKEYCPEDEGKILGIWMPAPQI
jgi:hypothetical protein